LPAKPVLLEIPKSSAALRPDSYSTQSRSMQNEPNQRPCHSGPRSRISPPPERTDSSAFYGNLEMQNEPNQRPCHSGPRSRISPPSERTDSSAFYGNPEMQNEPNQRPCHSGPPIQNLTALGKNRPIHIPSEPRVQNIEDPPAAESQFHNGQAGDTVQRPRHLPYALQASSRLRCLQVQTNRK